MKVLWITNVPLAGATQLLGQREDVFSGWLQGALSALIATGELQLTVASPGPGATRRLGVSAGVTYETFTPIRRRDAVASVPLAARLLRTVTPDLVHVHGTELSHSLTFAAAGRALSTPVVVSIQGLVSEIAERITAFLPAHVVHGMSSRPWVRSDRVAGMKRAFVAQGRIERETLRGVDHVIGRSTWDRACVRGIHPGARYHHCAETLRPSFYGPVHRAASVRPHSILVAQGHYPLKGLHIILRAMPAIVARFPDAVLTVAGKHPTAVASTPYARYLRKQIDSLGLKAHVAFTGELGEIDMVEQYLEHAVLACPSVVENSPNSVAEAMLLGMPVVAAHVGGVPDLVAHTQTGLTYEASADYMLSQHIIDLFEQPQVAERLGSAARVTALNRNDPARNARRTIDIYKDIAGGESVA